MRRDVGVLISDSLVDSSTTGGGPSETRHSTSRRSASRRQSALPARAPGLSDAAAAKGQQTIAHAPPQRDDNAAPRRPDLIEDGRRPSWTAQRGIADVAARRGARRATAPGPTADGNAK